MTKSKDQAANFTFVVDFDHNDNSEILRAVLPRTKRDYRRALCIFDKFLSLHPKAVNPPDIQTFKAFMEFAARGMKGRITARPTVATVDGFRGNFEAGMSFVRGHKFHKETFTTIREWILQELKPLLKLPSAEMDKDGLSPNDLTVLMTQLWCRDFHEYRGQPADRISHPPYYIVDYKCRISLISDLIGNEREATYSFFPQPGYIVQGLYTRAGLGS